METHSNKVSGENRSQRVAYFEQLDMYLKTPNCVFELDGT